MYHEDVVLEGSETVSGIAEAYGYLPSDVYRVWQDPLNAELVKKRGKPEGAKAGDVLWVGVPWRVTTRKLTATGNGASFFIKRDGGPGSRMSWVQTVYQGNQPVVGTTPSCVDACPPDDQLPFYWTAQEIARPPRWIQALSGDPSVNLTKVFGDEPARRPPSTVQGTTKWRAIVSIAVVNKKRVSVYDSWVWGFDLTSSGLSAAVGPRAAKPFEQQGHVNLLANGKGTAAGTFQSQGWNFRVAH